MLQKYRSNALKFIMFGMLIFLSSCKEIEKVIEYLGPQTTPGQDRTFGEIDDDQRIAALSVDRIGIEYPNSQRRIDYRVYQGRVLLVGIAADLEERSRISAIIRTLKGVRDVINELEIGSDTKEIQPNIIAEDKLRQRLSSDNQVVAVNYQFRIIGGVVYIIGAARTKEELDLVKKHAASVPWVERVVSYIKVRN